jgi:hypothetical protein
LFLYSTVSAVNLVCHCDCLVLFVCLVCVCVCVCVCYVVCVSRTCDRVTCAARLGSRSGMALSAGNNSGKRKASCCMNGIVDCQKPWSSVVDVSRYRTPAMRICAKAHIARASHRSDLAHKPCNSAHWVPEEPRQSQVSGSGCVIHKCQTPLPTNHSMHQLGVRLLSTCQQRRVTVPARRCAGVLMAGVSTRSMLLHLRVELSASDT